MEYIKPSIHGFTVYSKSGCPNCVTVKKFIKEKNFLLNSEINCDEYILEDESTSYLYSLCNWRSLSEAILISKCCSNISYSLYPC